ncbi:glycosyltransferase family 39 protein [Candidatus Daviesbacteria bacterium]|nr:glycosyltransferase family 39 protein [Candidatus Daviesbacteria bacterium]
MTRSNKYLLLILITLLAALLRLNNFQYEYGFYGDQGQDLLAINDWIRTNQVPLRGILTSIGSFYNGPIYYYLIFPLVIFFDGDPIAPVILFLIAGILTTPLVFYMVEKYVDSWTAFISSVLIALSSHTIFISKGAYAPNLQVFIFILMFYFFLNFIKTDKALSLFLGYLVIGVGVQFHYTFFANLFSFSLLLLILKRKKIVSARMILCAIGGFLLTLLPFILGQFFYNFADFKGMASYIINGNDQSRIITFQSITDRLVFPFLIYFRVELVPWFLTYFLKPIFLLILILCFVIGFTKNRLASFTKVVLFIFFASLTLVVVGNLNFWWWYNDFYSLTSIFMLAIVCSYLIQYGKLKFLGLFIFSVLIFWEIVGLPFAYGILRSPQIAKEIASIIKADIAKNKDKESYGILALNPIAPSQGFEYRYLLEKDGYRTRNAVDLADADYVIVEGKESRGIKIDTKLKINKINTLNFNDKSLLIKYGEIYKVERNQETQ